MNILLGVCGGIASYKSAYLTRLLLKKGHSVKVILTDSASDFVSPLLFSTLSRNECIVSFQNGNEWNNHVELAKWADLQLYAPLTANTLAKMSSGICDNILMACYFSADSPICVSPAMDLDMYKHPSVQRNLAQIEKDGVQIIDAEEGELASGLIGQGRMAEPESIISQLNFIPASKRVLKGKRVLINAGPTREAIDPVRFISNHSTGKMGLALAEKAYQFGAEVCLVLGPTSHQSHNPHIKVINVTNAQQMHSACVKEFENSDIAILSAAVADYKPKTVSSEKIKKKGKELTIELDRTKDILYDLGQTKRKDQILVGFALESENETSNAKEKLKKKNLDFIILNSIKDQGATFGFDTNKITIFDRKKNTKEFPLKTKEALSEDIIKYCQQFL